MSEEIEEGKGRYGVHWKRCFFLSVLLMSCMQLLCPCPSCLPVLLPPPPVAAGGPDTRDGECSAWKGPLPPEGEPHLW